MSYQSDNLFTDNRINALCDFFIEKLSEVFPPSKADPYNTYVVEGFILSGRAAAIMQDNRAGEIENITFQTDKADIYKWCIDNLHKFWNCKSIAFQNRLLLYPLDFYFEIWHTPGDLVITRYESIIIQDITLIPEACL